jgi:nitroreductase
MDTLEAIFTRRSVRNYQDKQVEPEKLEILLKAAMCAPSALNEQPWQFVVIDDRSIFEKIMRVYLYAGMLKSAPLAILVCGDVSLEKAPGNWVLDCSCAAQNMLLAAHSIGLGAVWSGIYPETDRMEALSLMLNLPEGLRPLALVGVGYPDGALPAPPVRFRPDRIHINDWNIRYER